MTTIYRDGISFKKWMNAVNELLVKKLGVTSEDLPDFLWEDIFEDRITPRMAIEHFLEQYGEG